MSDGLISENKTLSQVASFTVAVAAMYSASLLERATDSVLKFGLVRFFLPFLAQLDCNWSSKSQKK